MIGRAAWHYALVMAVGLALLVLWSARPALAKPGPPGPVAAPSAPPAQKAVPAAAAPANDPVAFSDVQPADFFYTPVQHLAGLGVISGYIDGTFRPYNQTTRAQMVKIVILGFDKPLQTPSAGYTFTDVPPTHPFFAFVETAFADNISTGYACGGPGEPCDAQGRRYFRPNVNVTRGQLSKIVVSAAGWTQQLPGSASFADVPLDSPFAPFVETAVCRGILSGYVCGSPGEPCDEQGRPYFRAGNPATRGQIAKIIYGATMNSAPCAFPPPAAPCTIFPADNIWNRDISQAPVHAQSAAYIGTINPNAFLHPGFASRLWQGLALGNPITIVGFGQPLVPIHFTLYPQQSDPGPYPVPSWARVQGGPTADGDRHTIVWDRAQCMEYDLYRAFPNADGSWDAGAGATWALRSNALRPDGWTSADAAGLPILPGLIRYDEVAAGSIRHAIRFTAYGDGISRNYVWPARHSDGSSTSPSAMPMGSRLRLKASVDTSGFDPQVQVILQALKTYGMILADRDSSNEQIDIDGDNDLRWNDDILHTLNTLHASDFEVVDVAGLMIDPNSGQSR